MFIEMNKKCFAASATMVIANKLCLPQHYIWEKFQELSEILRIWITFIRFWSLIATKNVYEKKVFCQVPSSFVCRRFDVVCNPLEIRSKLKFESNWTKLSSCHMQLAHNSILYAHIVCVVRLTLTLVRFVHLI